MKEVAHFDTIIEEYQKTSALTRITSVSSRAERKKKNRTDAHLHGN